MAERDDGDNYITFQASLDRGDAGAMSGQRDPSSQPSTEMGQLQYHRGLTLPTLGMRVSERHDSPAHTIR